MEGGRRLCLTRMTTIPTLPHPWGNQLESLATRGGTTIVQTPVVFPKAASHAACSPGLIISKSYRTLPITVHCRPPLTSWQTIRYLRVVSGRAAHESGSLTSSSTLHAKPKASRDRPNGSARRFLRSSSHMACGWLGLPSVPFCHMARFVGARRIDTQSLLISCTSLRLASTDFASSPALSLAQPLRKLNCIPRFPQSLSFGNPDYFVPSRLVHLVLSK